MATHFPSHMLSVWIDRDPREVYAFMAAPTNFPRWASGLCSFIEPAGDDLWLAQTSFGPMKMRFTPPNEFGILDHYVFPEIGDPIYVPMRVIANGRGSEISFTLFRQPDMSDEKFAEDAAWVERDLTTLKDVLERQASDH